MSVSSPGSVVRFALAALLVAGVSALARAAPPEVVLPDGLSAVSFAVAPADAAAGFVGPGSKIDVLATRRVGNKLESFQLLSDVLVVAIEIESVVGRELPEKVTLSVAATEKQVLALALAKARGCRVEVVLRHPDKKADKEYSADAVIKTLSAPEVAPAPRLVGGR